jgi:hypothetical protein
MASSALAPAWRVANQLIAQRVAEEALAPNWEPRHPGQTRAEWLQHEIAAVMDACCGRRLEALPQRRESL